MIFETIAGYLDGENPGLLHRFAHESGTLRIGEKIRRTGKWPYSISTASGCTKTVATELFQHSISHTSGKT